MHFVVESHIPYIKGLLEPFGTVDYLAPEEITPQAVANADALLVRTRTRCDSALLSGSRCSLVATATIGTDHLDLPWLASAGIEAASAPGCNAPAVAQYVMASILTLANRPASQYTIGIVGVGHVGKIVEKWARSLDMQVLLCDPPRQAAEGGDQWSTLDEIAEKADIITFHTPLDQTTRHMADADFFGRLRRRPIIINAARGAVVDNAALADALECGQVHHAVIDCWEGEPAISNRLLSLCSVATPHIAGYSKEGKQRATRMALDAVSRHFSLPEIDMGMPAPAPTPGKITAKAVLASYDPLADTAALKAAPASFEALRNTYALRSEVRPAKVD